MGLRVLAVGLRTAVETERLGVRIDVRSHLLGVQRGERAHVAPFLVGVVAPDAAADGEPVGDVAIDVNPAEVALVTGVLDDARIVDIGKGHVVAHCLALAACADGVLLHHPVLVDFIPPVGVRVCHVIIVSGLGPAHRVFLRCPPLVYRGLGELRRSAYVHAGLVVELHIGGHIGNGVYDLERLVEGQGEIV